MLYRRRDDWGQDHCGNPISGMYVWVCNQPANSNLTPPSPLAQIYADPAGTQPIKQPLQTDQNGNCHYYLAPGIYTVVYGGSRVVQTVLPDQLVDNPLAPGFNNDNSAFGTILGSIDGTNTVFTLSGSPMPIQSLVLMVNGIVQMGFSLSGAIVTLAVAPQPGDTISARYTVQIQE